ncbi:MAG: hypothetical protein CTY12_03295 [Methylotenera sp.]|nr:MAG: hypothetical protein CTY12_03295 [Methylotenera sp.]
MTIHDNKHLKLIKARNPHVADKITQLWGTDKFVPYMNSLDTGIKPVLDFISQAAAYELMAEHQVTYPTKSMCIVTAVQNTGQVIASSLKKVDVWELSGAGRVI